jgi:hypothetical protein
MKVMAIIEVLERHEIAHLIQVAHGGHPLFVDLKAVELRVLDDKFDLDLCRGLFEALFDMKSDDISYAFTLWSSAVQLVERTLRLDKTPRSATPPQTDAPSAEDTPFSANTASVEHATGIKVPDIKLALREELEGKLVLDHPDFERVYFDGITGLGDMVERAFEFCQQGPEPLYTAQRGWSGLQAYNQARALPWFRSVFERIGRMLQAESSPPHHYRAVQLPDTPLHDSDSLQKLDIAICQRDIHQRPPTF